MPIDRERRDLLGEAIDRYLDERLSAFEFDEAIFEIAGQTKDETVKHVVYSLWCCYDDFEDHKVVLDRVGWNFIQRLRLLLKSNAMLEVSKKRIWSASQVVAAVGVVSFAWATYRLGFGQDLLVVVVLLGIVSIALSKWRGELYRGASTMDVSLHPFTSISQLLWVAHDVPDFRKAKYPAHIARRRIRSAVTEFYTLVQMFKWWLVYSPVALLAQVFPVSVSEERVVV